MESDHVAEEGLESSRLVGCVHCIVASDVHILSERGFTPHQWPGGLASVLFFQINAASHPLVEFSRGTWVCRGERTAC